MAFSDHVGQGRRRLWEQSSVWRSVGAGGGIMEGAYRGLCAKQIVGTSC